MQTGSPGSPSDERAHSWGCCWWASGCCFQCLLLWSLAPKNARARRSSAGEWCVCVALKGVLCSARARAPVACGECLTLGSWAPACVPTQCWKRWVGPSCQQPRPCLSSVGAERGMVLSPELVAVSSLGGCAAQLGILQPWLLGFQWWGPNSIGRMWWLQHLPFPCLQPSPWPREHGQWQNCPFCASGRTVLSQETANCAHWQSITLPQSGPLLWGQLGPVARVGTPLPLLFGLPVHCCGEGSTQPPVMPINTAKTGVGCCPTGLLRCGNGAG